MNTFGYRMLAFVIASFFAGLAGALYAHYVGTVNPNRFSVEEMVYVLIWAIVGGTATFYGPILGVVVLTILNEVVLRALGVDEMRPMFYGAILILFILFLPKGLESLVPKIKGWLSGGKSQARSDGASGGSGIAGGISERLPFRRCDPCERGPAPAAGRLPPSACAYR